jgi:GNAT superfamily N-acetyltransferase
VPMTDTTAFPFSDAALARRLERAEAEANSDAVDARARLFPGSGAAWLEVAGARAMFDGVDSPLTQTFGLGLFDAVTPAELEAVERFFQERGAPVFHEVSPLADPALLPLLNERGYHPIELTSVLVRPLAAGDASATPPRLSARRSSPGEESVWTATSAKGWGEFPELAAFMEDIGRLTFARRTAHAFLAMLDGDPIATGVLSIHGDVALLAGASTIPAARGQGAQQALLDARLRFAADQGCTLAMMCALPGGGSQRNAERHGFRVAYTRIKWRLGVRS